MSVSRFPLHTAHWPCTHGQPCDQSLPNSLVMIPLLGPMSGSEAAAGRRHTQSNKPHNINLPCQIYCKGTHASLCTHTATKTTARRQLPRHPVSNTDRQRVKKRLDAVRHPFNSQGVENIGMTMNSVCTASTVLTCVCGREKYSLLGFLQQHIIWNKRSRAVHLQSLPKSLIYVFKDRRWLHFHAHQ